MAVARHHTERTNNDNEIPFLLVGECKNFAAADFADRTVCRV